MRNIINILDLTVEEIEKMDYLPVEFRARANALLTKQ